MVLHHVEVPLMLNAESDTVTSITIPTLPPVITSLEGIKPSDTDSRWLEVLVQARHALLHVGVPLA